MVTGLTAACKSACEHLLVAALLLFLLKSKKHKHKSRRCLKGSTCLKCVLSGPSME